MPLRENFPTECMSNLPEKELLMLFFCMLPKKEDLWNVESRCFFCSVECIKLLPQDTKEEIKPAGFLLLFLFLL